MVGPCGFGSLAMAALRRLADLDGVVELQPCKEVFLGDKHIRNMFSKGSLEALGRISRERRIFFQ